MRSVSVTGASGDNYRYDIHGEHDLPPVFAGNYLFVRNPDYNCEVLYVGQSDNVYRTIMASDLWRVAKRRFGATHILVHGNNLGDFCRRSEAEDLVGAYNPPMNAAALAA